MMPLRAILWNGWYIDAAFAGAIVLLTIGVYFTAVSPLVVSRAQARHQQMELARQRREAHDLSTAVANLNHELVDLQQAIDAGPVQLQPVHRINLRLAQINALAEECGMTIDEISPGEAIDGEHFKSVPIRVVAVGDYPTCTGFVHQFQQRFRDSRVIWLELNAGSPSEDVNHAKAVFKLAWYAAPTE